MKCFWRGAESATCTVVLEGAEQGQTVQVLTSAMMGPFRRGAHGPGRGREFANKYADIKTLWLG